jgi:serine protease
MIKRITGAMLASGVLLAVGASLLARPVRAAAAAHRPGLPQPAPAGHPGSTAHYLPGVVIVGIQQPGLSLAADRATAAAVDAGNPPDSIRTTEIHVPHGLSVAAELRRLRAQRNVAFAEPDYLAHIAGTTPAWTPNDPGRAGTPMGWEKMQWNFLPSIGVNAPEAWANLRAVHRGGARGVVIAILDTGVAYRKWHRFRKSPDFRWTRFVAPRDFVAHNRFPLDREGHGTFVTGTIAESTDNGFGLTGLAYKASIMPVRVLDRNGWGDAATIARGIRYAVWHAARVINLSLEFDPSVTARQIPSIMSAIRFAHQHGVVVVAAAGNEASASVAYPARAPAVISVGATTMDRCLAYYSNNGSRLDLVAPGGGDDAFVQGDPNCDPNRSLPDIYQLTFGNASRPGHFGYPGHWDGTSMAAPHVSAAAAMVIASGVLGRHPSPDRILHRLEQTAQPLGGSKPNRDYGWGLIDIGAATSPQGSPQPTVTTTASSTTVSSPSGPA